MNELTLENDLSALAAKASSDPTFLRDLPIALMRAYQAPAAQITRTIRDNDARINKVDATLLDVAPRDFVWAKQFHYAPSTPGQVHDVVERLRTEQKPKAIPGKTCPRFLLSSDGDAFAAVDLKTGEAFSGERLADLPTHYDFLQPLAGIERYAPPSEQQADVKAAKIMRELHNAIVAHDPSWREPERTEALNVFLTRLLFCLFADGAGIFDSPATADRPAISRPFKRLLMTTASAKDGNTTGPALTAAFRTLDMRDDDPRRPAQEPLVRALPYANGRLFEAELPVPSFDRRARYALRQALDLDWSEINADIFGSMLQAVASDADRSHFGMHYTSVPNIMKVIGPLFVDRLNEQLTEAGHQPRKLRAFLDELATIHVFDPACGSGNFLIIAYQSLRSIETTALARLKTQQPDMDLRSRIRLDHFHGIDPVDFSCRTARLSLWISQIKADRELVAASIPAEAILPLHDAGDIRCASALTLPWTDVVPAGIGPTYIVGNPPYLGSKGGMQTSAHKAEMDHVFKDRLSAWRSLDYVAAWFALAALHIAATGSKAAFVSTNSICQGEHVPMLWPYIKKIGVEIFFAHTSFKWANSAARNAGVACAIIGMRSVSPNSPKTLRHEVRSEGGTASIIVRDVRNISPYLTSTDDVIVERRQISISGLPEVVLGNQPTDGGHLLLDRQERSELLSMHPEAQRFLKPIMGSKEFIRGEDRWCLWIEDHDRENALGMSAVRKRIEAVKAMRLASPKVETNRIADISHSFADKRPTHKGGALIIPMVSSESRPYLQCGIVQETVVSNTAYSVVNAQPWLMALLSTRMMHQWTATVGSKLEDRTRFSNTMVYNTFPVPTMNDKNRERLNDLGLMLIEIRQPHLDDGRTIAWLYNPETMPDDLRAIHEELDEEFEGMYVGRRFRDDAERLEHLFRLYARMKGTTK